jgi:hypothetical protein
MIASAGQAGQFHGPYQLKMVIAKPMSAATKPRLNRIERSSR